MTRKGTKQAMLRLWAEPSGERRLSVYDRWGQLVSRAQGAGGGKGPGAGAVYEEPTVSAQTDGAGSPISQAECVWAEPGRRPTTKLTDAKPDGGGLGFILGRSDNLDGQLAGRTDPDGGGHNFVGDNGRLIQIILPNQNRMGRGDDNGSFRNASISPTEWSDEPRMLCGALSPSKQMAKAATLCFGASIGMTQAATSLKSTATPAKSTAPATKTCACPKPARTPPCRPRAARRGAGARRSGQSRFQQASAGRPAPQPRQPIGSTPPSFGAGQPRKPKGDDPRQIHGARARERGKRRRLAKSLPPQRRRAAG